MNNKSKKIAEIKKIIEANFNKVFQDSFRAKLDDELDDKKSYNIRLYGPHLGSRRFLALNRFKMFELYHTGYFGIGRYVKYRRLAKESWGRDGFIDSLAVFTFAVCYDHELEDPELLEEFIVNKAGIWWQRRVLWTVWQGKTKELIFGRDLAAALPSEYSLRKPTEREDQEYMLDWVLEKNGKIELGISVKGESYRYSKDHNITNWVKEKEHIEESGHEKFTQSFGKKVITAISSYNDPELVAEEVEDILYFLKHGRTRSDLPTYSSPADSPWMNMSGDFPELEF